MSLGFGVLVRLDGTKGYGPGDLVVLVNSAMSVGPAPPSRVKSKAEGTEFFRRIKARNTLLFEVRNDVEAFQAQADHFFIAARERNSLVQLDIWVADYDGEKGRIRGSIDAPGASRLGGLKGKVLRFIPADVNAVQIEVLSAHEGES
jgi:hypothetical protein